MDRAAYLASYDDLTGLANRRLLSETLMTRLATVPAGRVALLYVDLDGFKAVNDRHGHPRRRRTAQASGRPAALPAARGGMSARA